ncbi:MAG: GTPase HflX [Candidatus Hodarchaeota archaeon]
MQQSEPDVYSPVLQHCYLILPYPLNEHQDFLNNEMRLLLKSANYLVLAEYEVKSNNANYLFSPHHLQEIKFEINIDSSRPIIVVGSHLKANQHIKLEELFECPIIDKYELVLEIFADRAMTEESKLQIELAELKYEKPRERLRLMHTLGLEGAWHTERSGFWGPGETPLNIFEAAMTKKEARLKQRLNFLREHREKRRSKRKRYHQDSLYVSLVGYTSSGKSTILNAFTNSQASSVSSRLFETLDTRVRGFYLEDLKIFVTDTVGFIEDLPTFLIDSFKSTLEESLAADILLIIIDASEPLEYVLKKSQVSVQTINQIYPQNFRVLVLNKIDLLDGNSLEERIKHLKRLFPELQIVTISAINDIQPLIAKIGEYRPKRSFRCSYSPNYQFRSFCFNFTNVIHETFSDDNWIIEFTIRKPDYGIEVLKHQARTLGLEVEMKAL